MTHKRIAFLILLAMIAFAGNSILCRIALKQTGIDAVSFTTIRLVSGAIFLWLIVRFQGSRQSCRGSWVSSFALFIYAAGFSFAYVSLTTATGALLLFGAVQATMLGYGLLMGERLDRWQITGLMLALCGIVVLLFPGLSAPPVMGAALMLVSGVAWGVYSIRGKGSGDPTGVTARNFLRTVPLSMALSILTYNTITLDSAGCFYAILSGALASGVGYAVWYRVVPALRATSASAVQLSVPVIAALGGIMFLSEPITLRLILSSVAILGGIMLVIKRAAKESSA